MYSFIALLIIAFIVFLLTKAGTFSGKRSNKPTINSKTIPQNKVEQLNEEEFISFVKNNYGFYDKYFKNEGIGGGHRLETKYWSTNKYTIKSTIDTNEFNDFIEVYRKTDNKMIYSGCWGPPSDEESYENYDDY